MDNFEHNRESWNELTALHTESSFYDVEGFKKGKTSLNRYLKPNGIFYMVELEIGLCLQWFLVFF